MANPVVHFEVVGSDVGKLIEFYRGLFGWKIDTNNPQGYGTIDNEGEGINGGIGPAAEGFPGHVTFYVAVDDLQATLTKAESMGGKTLMPPAEVMEGLTIALFADPEGHVIGILTGGM